MESVVVKHYFAKCKDCTWRGEWLAPLLRLEGVNDHLTIPHPFLRSREHHEIITWEERHYG